MSNEFIKLINPMTSKMESALRTAILDGYRCLIESAVDTTGGITEVTDKSAMLDLIMQCAKEVRASYMGSAEDSDELMNEANEMAGHCTYALMYQDKAIIGVIENSATKAFIDVLYVAPEFRGQGIADQLVRAVTDRYNRVDLCVHRDNAGARRLYERLGFKVREADLDGRENLHMSFRKA